MNGPIINLHKGTSLIDRAIRWQTRSPYSHASVIVFDSLFEAVHPKIRQIWDVNPQHVDSFTLDVTPEQRREMHLWLGSQVGKPYDLTMVLRFVTRQQEARESSGKWFCSELVFAAFAHIGIHLLDRIEPWEVSPALLANSPLLRPV